MEKNGVKNDIFHVICEEFMAFEGFTAGEFAARVYGRKQFTARTCTVKVCGPWFAASAHVYDSSFPIRTSVSCTIHHLRFVLASHLAPYPHKQQPRPHINKIRSGFGGAGDRTRVSHSFLLQRLTS